MKIEELKDLREKHPKSQRATDPNVQSIRPYLATKDSGKPFVFISYKSDDWYVVLHEIVYTLAHDYGLNVYYDGSFDDHLPNWIEQFPPNMASIKCRAVLTFRSDRYDCSYATLMEVMYSQGMKCRKLYEGKTEKKAMTLLPINLTQSREVTDEEAEQNTGLGVEIYADNTRNEHYKKELDLFNKSFMELTERGIIKEGRYLYDPADEEEILTNQHCSEIMKELFAGRANNNDYPMDEDERSKFFASLTTMLREIDPRVFDSRARLKPGDYYVPESGATAEDRRVTAAQQPSPTASDVIPDDTISDTPVGLNGKAPRSGSAVAAPKAVCVSDSRERPVPESGIRRITGNGYDASFTYTTVINSKNETEYRITLHKDSKVKLASHIKTGWKYDKKHRSDIDENSGILKNDIPDLTTSAAECIIKGNSCSGKAIRILIGEADAAVPAGEKSDPKGKETETVFSQETAVVDPTEIPTAEDPVPDASKTGIVCSITGSDYDASFIFTSFINSKDEKDYRITLLKGSKVKLASHMKTGWKYARKHRADIDETTGLLKNDIPDLTTSAAECIIKGNSCSGQAIKEHIKEAVSKVM